MLTILWVLNACRYIAAIYKQVRRTGGFAQSTEGIETLNSTNSKLRFREMQEGEQELIQHYMNELYATDISEATPGLPPPNLANTLEEFRRAPGKGCVIAVEYDSQLVGYAILVFFWSNEFAGDIIEIDELFIAADYRNKGLARQFFQWLEYSYLHCAGFSLQVSKKNANARRLYERLGFQPRVDTVMVNMSPLLRRQSKANSPDSLTRT